jgi:hypothetical protein
MPQEKTERKSCCATRESNFNLRLERKISWKYSNAFDHCAFKVTTGGDFHRIDKNEINNNFNKFPEMKNHLIYKQSHGRVAGAESFIRFSFAAQKCV